ncbi:transglutaminase-like cysteine peptidase [Undibacterium sp.]|uniref:transglutaminase-like cysteine peptidase n=1 Tax=Undibacterium sp. TaxID=1914977 RepID=UPI0025E49079|nr:transglutaminase-like cysteine peptidase [Undibacterium sp.]
MPTPLRLLSTFSKLAFVVLSSLVLIPGNALDLGRIQASLKNLGGNQQVFVEWSAVMQSYGEATIETKLQKVNEFFNRKILYTDDLEVWGQSDYWATPMESLAKGKGDCEDYVIAKYFTLRNMNIPDKQLRLIYVKARIGGPASNVQQAHMVLAYYASGEAEPLILDNLISEIRPASRRSDLFPVFSFNGQGVFAGAAANAALGPGGTGRLSRWQDLLERARREGFD